MRANSLAVRLFLSATAWTVVILLITGFVLSSLYREAVERSFDRRLNVFLRTLVAEVAAPDGWGGARAVAGGGAAVRSAAVGLVRAAHPPQSGAAGGALVAFAVGFRAPASQRPGRADARGRHPARLRAGARGPAPAPH